jgi:hypothetical protein
MTTCQLPLFDMTPFTGWRLPFLRCPPMETELAERLRRLQPGQALQAGPLRLEYLIWGVRRRDFRLYRDGQLIRVQSISQKVVPEAMFQKLAVWLLWVYRWTLRWVIPAHGELLTRPDDESNHLPKMWPGERGAKIN